MRKIMAGLFISLDGVVEAPETWHFPYFDDQMGAAVGEMMGATDTMLLGRQTYQEFAAYWPAADADDPTAAAMNGTPKLVASRTLDRVDWENSTLLEGDAADALRAIKAEPGGDIGITGSPTLVRSLLDAGVLDELRLLVHPIVVGHGKRLFPDGTTTVPLELTASTVFDSGVLFLTYRRATAAAPDNGPAG
jgi:dihydrofolate reductase